MKPRLSSCEPQPEKEGREGGGQLEDGMEGTWCRQG